MRVPVITNNPHAARAGIFGDGDVVIFPLDGDPERLPDLIDGLARADTRQTIRTMDEFIADLLDDSSATRTKARLQ